MITSITEKTIETKVIEITSASVSSKKKAMAQIGKAIDSIKNGMFLFQEAILAQFDSI